MRTMSAGRPIACALAVVVSTIVALGGRALADHPDGLRTEMSPMATAVLMGGLALAAVLLVLVVAMLLTRRAGAPVADARRKDAHGE